ncbi:MAG: TerC family protein [Methylocystis sp.]|nr:TerC family protein [Methylocystis sp.]MCA3583478.1 TerC family protein [Methylocystis sp.]MCA3587100.1 TerC family protein [Methylocystis sp.]MCA3592773.1 TerC family protein [Methylocystis sp.]
MADFVAQYGWPVLQIVWIDLLLSGDNAIVIALACRNLPPEQRRMGMLLGAGAAIGLRIIFALMITFLLGVPFLKIIGGLLLLWIGVKLATGEDEAHEDVKASDQLWGAVKTIAIADAVMSLDNVLAISAASHGNVWLFIFGLLLSIPLIIFGAQLITSIIERFPVFIWLGAALLGWIAGEMIATDPIIIDWLKANMPAWVMPNPKQLTEIIPIKMLYYGAAAVGAAIVLTGGAIMRRRPASA